MGITKREVADQLGVAKQTVVNYIDKLGLAPEHVTRIGKTDILDNFAVSALADALGKNIPPRAAQEEEDVPEAQDSVIAALNGRIADLKEQHDRLVAEIAEMRAARDHEVADLRAQLAEANDRAAVSPTASRASPSASRPLPRSPGGVAASLRPNCSAPVRSRASTCACSMVDRPCALGLARRRAMPLPVRASLRTARPARPEASQTRAHSLR